MLGLSEVLTGGTHKVTAEAVTESELCFISRGTFLNYLREHPELCMQIVRQLSEELHGLYHHYRADRSRKSPVPPRVN